MLTRLFLAIAAFLVLLVASTNAAADTPACDGPPECCPDHPVRPTDRRVVSIGVVIMIWLRLYFPFTPCPSI